MAERAPRQRAFIRYFSPPPLLLELGTVGFCTTESVALGGQVPESTVDFHAAHEGVIEGGKGGT